MKTVFDYQGLAGGGRFSVLLLSGRAGTGRTILMNHYPEPFSRAWQENAAYFCFLEELPEVYLLRLGLRVQGLGLFFSI